MIKSTQSQIANRVITALNNQESVVVNFKTTRKDADLEAAVKSAINRKLFASVTATAKKMIQNLESRVYSGKIVRVDASGLVLIKLDDGQFKSFYMNHISKLIINGYEYTK